MTVIAGYCPACGEDYLLAARDPQGAIEERLHCQAEGCPDPDAAHRLLSKRDPHVHLVKFRKDGYTVQHPLLERVSPEGLFGCVLDEQFSALSEPPGIGLYRVPPGGSLADMAPVDEDEVDYEVPDPEPPVIRIGTIVPVSADAEVPDGWMEMGEEPRPIPNDCTELLEWIEAEAISRGVPPVEVWPFWCEAVESIKSVPAVPGFNNYPSMGVDGGRYLMRVR